MKVDVLVLGCTHYPIIKDVIKKVQPDTEFVNPGVLVAVELKNYLIKNGLINNRTTSGKKDFFVTDLNERFKKVTKMFLGKGIPFYLTLANLNYSSNISLQLF